MGNMTTLQILQGVHDWVLDKIDEETANFITKTVNDLVNYYTKSETYTKVEVQQIVDAIKQFTYEVVQVLPTASASTMNKIYLVPAPKSEDKNVKEEYITIQDGSTYSWEMLGTTSIDLSNYYTKGQTDSAISSALSSALASYTTTADLTTLLAQKQDVIQDLADIRSGASAGSTAVQPSTLSDVVKNVVAESGVYDVSANNDNTKFESLSALLSSANLNTLIPTDIRKGGMSIKFVLTSDNKYVQYRYTSNSTAAADFTNTANWQGVDDTPTEGSENLVESGGVYTELEKKANIDGYYETMGVGTADNLTGQTERTDDAMYRKTGGSEEVASGTATIANIKGKTIAWNQLVDTDTTEVTPVNGRKICTVIGGVKSIITSDGSAIAVSGGTDMVFDITLIYGAGSEPTTVEQFEADYFKWFGKPLTYEEYDAGSLRSVQLDSLKTTGFNQYNNGQARVIGGLQYQITGTYTGITLGEETITPDANGLFTPSATGTLIVTGGGNDTCIHISGDRNGEYEPYEEHSVSLPVTTITGKLNGEGESVVVFPDGMKSAGTVYDEIYTVGDKTYAIKRVGSVDLGTLTWEKFASMFRTAPFKQARFIGNNAEKSNILNDKYRVSSVRIAGDNTIILFDTKRIVVYDSDRYASLTAAEFKSFIAGSIFYYELLNPQEYILDDFQLPIRIQVDALGTEEQITPSGIASVPAIIGIKYVIDAVRFILNAPKNYISAESMDNFLSRLGTAIGGTWSKTWNDNTGKWDFSFTPNAQTNDTNIEETI